MGRVCGCLLEVVTFKNRSTGGPFLFTGLQGINQWKIITASPTSAHGFLQEGVTYERFLLQGFEWENFGVLHRWSLTRGGRTWRLACNRVLQEWVITLSPTPNLEARGVTLRLVSTLRLFWREWLYPPLMNVTPSPTYHECEYPLCSCHQSPVLGRTIK